MLPKFQFDITFISFRCCPVIQQYWFCSICRKFAPPPSFDTISSSPTAGRKLNQANNGWCIDPLLFCLCRRVFDRLLPDDCLPWPGAQQPSEWDWLHPRCTFPRMHSSRHFYRTTLTLHIVFCCKFILGFGFKNGMNIYRTVFCSPLWRGSRSPRGPAAVIYVCRVGLMTVLCQTQLISSAFPHFSFWLHSSAQWMTRLKSLWGFSRGWSWWITSAWPLEHYPDERVSDICIFRGFFCTRTESESNDVVVENSYLWVFLLLKKIQRLPWTGAP